MSAPSTVDQFVELAHKSGLLDAEFLQDYVRRRAERGQTGGPRELAGELMREGLLTRFQVDQLLLGRWRNFILCGKYRVLEPLGSGGMGNVFLCEHQVMRRRVAVKVLPNSRSANPVSLERFHREARAAAQLHHPNIVAAYDVDRDGKLHFLVMEYVDGSTLHQIVKRRGPLDPLRAAHYVRQAAVGLQHAHEHGLVHRDVKPSNLVVDRDGTVKVLDMGLALFFHDESDDLSRRNVENALGTTDYMAPEQALDSHSVDIRADVYGLGATFYFLLAGHGPFQEGTTLQKIIWHQVRQPRPVREIRPEVPEGLAAIVHRMMAKDPGQRYQTPAEVAEALAPWTATPIPPPPREEMPDHSSGIPTPPAGGASSFTPLSRPATPAPPPSGPPPELPAPPQAAREPTAPRGGGPPRTPVRDRRVWVLAAAIGGVLLLGAGGLGLALYLNSTRKGPTPGPGPRPGPPPARADGPRLRLLVPAYIYPGGDGLKQWERLLAAADSVPMVIIANADSGPGKEPNPDLVKVLTPAMKKDVMVIGYVSTRYGARPLQEVKEDVGRWLRFYPGIQGIFFDEQASGAEKVSYYATLYDHVRKEHGLKLVVNNPGNACAEEYFARPAADVICLVESKQDFAEFRPKPWVARYPADRVAALLRNPVAGRMRQDILAMPEKNVGYCFVTDGKDPNPWDRLPGYWDQELAAVRKVNERKGP